MFHERRTNMKYLKKPLIFLLVVALVFTMCACDRNSVESEDDEDESTPKPTSTKKADWSDWFNGEGDEKSTPEPTQTKTVIPTSTPTVQPTPVQDENNLLIWWEQGAKDVALLQDAWYDFTDLYAGKTGPSGTVFSRDMNMFYLQGDINGTTALEQQIIAGTAPDIVRMDHVYVTALGQKGLVFDLQEKWQATEKISEQFIASTWEASSYLDAVYGVPFDANTIVFGASASVLDQAGVSMPTTYEELRSAGAKIKELNLDQTVYTLPCGTDARYNWPAFVFLTWLWRLGGDVLNEDMTEAIFHDTETGVAALNMMIQLQADGLISATAYEEGQTVMCDYGTWWMDRLQEDMKFSLQLELKEGVPQYSGLGLYDLAVVRTSKNPDLAYDFVVHLATGKNSITGKHYVYTFCKNHNLIPSCIAATEEDDWYSGTASDFWKVSVEQLKLSKYRPAIPCWEEIEQVLSIAIMQAINGERAPKDALNAAAATANRFLDEWHAAQNNS